MILWLHKDFETIEEDEDLNPISFEEPEDGENWTRLSSRDEHYKDMLADLESLSAEYDRAKNFTAKRVCDDLAQKVRTKVKSILWH